MKIKHLGGYDFEVEISDNDKIMIRADTENILLLAILDKLEEIRCELIDIENATEGIRTVY